MKLERVQVGGASGVPDMPQRSRNNISDLLRPMSVKDGKILANEIC